MCELCSQDQHVREAAKAQTLSAAQTLDALAENLRRMAHGQIDPHSQQASHVATQARAAVRWLVGEFV